MTKKLFLLLITCLIFTTPAWAEYRIGVNDILEVSVLQPDAITRVVNVAPDGTITFPYIGSVEVKGFSIDQVKEMIHARLSNGYMRHPVVLVSLQESRSKKYFVYGEVVNPGSFPMSEDTTVLTAISISGGFTKFGSSSKVKLLRSRKNAKGYETIPVDIKAVMSGNANEDILLQSGDILVVSGGIF